MEHVNRPLCGGRCVVHVHCGLYIASEMRCSGKIQSAEQIAAHDSSGECLVFISTASCVSVASVADETSAQ